MATPNDNPLKVVEPKAACVDEDLRHCFTWVAHAGFKSINNMQAPALTRLHAPAHSIMEDHRAARSCKQHDRLTEKQKAWHPVLRNTVVFTVVLVSVEREHGFGLRAVPTCPKQSEGRSLLSLHQRIHRVVHIWCHGMCISAATGAPRGPRPRVTSPHGV